MPIEWPTNLWGEQTTDPDTEEFRRARDEAVAKVLKLRMGLLVAVSGSSRSHEYKDEARKLGKLIARQGYSLTTGGLDGVMFDVTDGYVHPHSFLSRFFDRSSPVRGVAIGIVPKGRMALAEQLAKKLPGSNLVKTELSGTDSHGSEARHIGPASRNHVLIGTADIVVCMPGNSGSIAEAILANEVYRKPVAAYVPNKGQTETKWHQIVRKLTIPTFEKLESLQAWLVQTIASSQA